MQRVNVIGAGKVGQTLLRRLEQSTAYRAGDILGRRPDSPPGTVASMEAMRPAEIWALTVPDDRIAAVAEALAASRAADHTRPVAFHCSGFLGSDVLAPLRDLGWHVASCHPVLGFGDPAVAAAQFPGTPCGIEGDAAAVDPVARLMTDLGGRPFAVASDRKPLYHAAAVFSNNFTTVLQAVAHEAWLAAGVAPEVADGLGARLLHSTAVNVARLGPAGALTGPAARGDTEVLRRQQATLDDWHPEAAELYRLMTRLARRLAADGRIWPQAGGARPAVSRPPVRPG